MPSDALQLEVDGVGQVRLPVRPTQAKKLCGVARPAHFGHREETILDPAVRDTWEISPDLVRLGGPSWAPAMEGALTELAYELGVPAGSRLEAELHALLVYGPGQFFVPHQDTEKNDAMVGTLTVTLPSSHTGGEFIIEHGGQSVTYRSSRDSLSLVLHRVTPGRTGYRVALTFNLLLRGTPATGPAGGPVPELAGYLAEHFSSPEQVRYGSSEPPKRLVYLLDHKYTERGLPASSTRSSRRAGRCARRYTGRWLLKAGAEAVPAPSTGPRLWAAGSRTGRVQPSARRRVSAFTRVQCSLGASAFISRPNRPRHRAWNVLAASVTASDRFMRSNTGRLGPLGPTESGK
jgi:2OG-Fe(II) oxygenase superfamily